ncbi:condensin-2 complex subunit G2 isoform X2 [Dicentrarchus labrax]|uniref:Condensin-2 complex subunit G2 n=1 Tax=Dicentrarchus labrax TaxID=13489 RepID=E6ZJ15_DICLA|nr:condensin-2 complex subunit G2 isoform X2 [Dicentrarchus labrax]CBN82049.1 Condensin-2 complex subunit G2 [Dicentrarchus labrax]
MSKRAAFLTAACKENVEDFLHFIQLHKDKADPFDVEEVVQEMPRDQRQTLWGKLASLLHDILQELPPERWEKGREEGMEVESAADPKHVIAVVEGVTLVAEVSLKVLQDGDTYSALLEITDRLHDVLVSLPVSEAPLQLHIHILCEAWWKKDLKEKEKFGRTAFFISLQKSFILKKPGAEIQRVWSLHDVLLSLDYTSEDNKQIIDLLLQCFHRPIYIRNDDGKRFLVFLFSWNVDFIWVIHGTIKNQLEFYSKTMTTHIMEIYFRAWKKASGDFLEQIESSCIQDFMQNAIFLHRASPVHAKVRQIVSYFHSRKGCNKVDKMLYDLYRPFLWKALTAPNFEVRANATLLFTEAFPVHDPDQNNQNIDETIQKQLDTAMSLLDDPHPTVRSNATLGVCKILAKCWELLPPTIITDFLKKLVMELAADSSSPDVRCSVFKCLTIVLDNTLSHPLLEKLLPTLKYSLHDNSEKVRTAFLDMLIKVKAVRAAKFWDVCNMDHLLARLAIDSQSVSKRIVDLLFKSFFPVNESEREWCCRCITLIQMNPMAARKFYQLAHKHTAPTNIIKLMLAIRRVLNSCIQTDCDLSDINDSNKENSTAEPLLGKDVAVVSRLLEVVVILWRSVEKALKQNEEAQKYTFAKFGNVMAKYFQAFEDEQCTVPLIQLASFMPAAAVPTFSCGVLSRLRKMDPGAVPAQYSQLLDCMCSWGQAANILELVTDWLTEALPKQGDKANTNRKVRILETVEAKPDLALAYLEYLFSHTSTREKVLALGERPLKQLHTILGNWRSVLYTHLSSTTEDPKTPSVETALKVFMYYGRLGAHLQHNSSEGRDYLLSLEHVAAWVAERVLPFLAKRTNDDEEEEDSEKSQPLAAQITESFLTVCRDVLLVGLGDETLKGHILHLCSLTLLSDAGYLCIPAVLPILKEVADCYVPEDNNQAQDNQGDATTVILGVVANIFQKIIELLARRLRKEPEEGKQLCQSAVPGLTGFLQVAQTWDRAPLSGVFSTVFAVIVVEKRHLLQKITHPEEVITPESMEDMPPLSGVLLSVILKVPAVTRAFLAEVSSSLDSEAISSLNELAAVLHVLAVIKHTGQSKAGLKSAATSVQQQLYKHAVTSVDSRDIQRVIYESSVKTLNEILDL